MMTLIIDGIDWSSKVLVNSLHLAAQIRTKNDAETQRGKMHYYTVGTAYIYTLDIYRGARMTDAEWEELFLQLSEPVNFHDLTVPFGVNGTLDFRAHIEIVEKDLEDDICGNLNWSKHIAITLTPEEPQRRIA